jgi:hypothetical protein
MTDLIPFVKEGMGPGYGALLLLAGMVLTWMKIRPALVKMRLEDNTSLRGDLFTRIRELERALKEEQDGCDQKLAAMQTTCDEKMNEMQGRLDMLMDALLASKHKAEKE